MVVAWLEMKVKRWWWARKDMVGGRIGGSQIQGGRGLGAALEEGMLCCGCRAGGKVAGWSALLIWRLRADGDLFHFAPLLVLIG